MPVATVREPDTTDVPVPFPHVGLVEFTGSTEWRARLRQLESLDLGAPAADLVQADRAARDLEPFPQQRQP